MIKVTIQPTSARSLAMHIKPQVEASGKFEQPGKKAWELAKKVFGNYDQPTINECESIINQGIVSPVEVNADLSIIVNKEGSKNAKIREALTSGFTVSAIAKAMGLSYQRVKNVEKQERRKTETK